MKRVPFKEVLRYFISAAGITIGIFILVSVLEIFEGGRTVLKENFWSDGVKIYEIQISEGFDPSGDYLEQSDGRFLEERMLEVKDTIPILSLDAKLSSYKESEAVRTLAVNEGYMQYANLEMLKGDFISEEDVKTANRIVAIDDLTALELFGTTDITGQQLELQVGSRKLQFVVVGVFKNYNKNIETLFEDELPGLCLIPDSVPREVSFDFQVERLVAAVDENLHPEAAEAMLGHLLGKEHGVEGVYSIEEYEQLPKVSEFIDKYLVFAAIAAAIGFVAGGIGVMNALLLFIHERKREIGIYKFYGAAINELKYDIVYRSLVICTCCGALGLVMGVFTGNYIGGFINLPVRFSLTSVFAATVFSGAAGVASGLYPASRIDLVDAQESIWGE